MPLEAGRTAGWHGPCIPGFSETVERRREATVANDDRAREQPTSGELEAISPAQARGGPHRPVEGITERTSQVNSDSADGVEPHPELQAHGGSEQGGMAGPVGYFEGEGNEGPLAPLGGAPTKSADDGATNSQGGVASGAPG
jgi:hypothetical protein